MMRTLARRTKAWRARSRTSWTGKRPGTRSVPPPQPPSSGRRQPQQFFCPHGAFEHLRLPACCCQPAIAARAPGYAGTTSWRLPAAVSAPWAKSRRQVKSWFGATPWRRATKRTNHARLERLLDDPDFLRRCPAPTALNRRENPNSIRRIGHRHGCMPLAKWETGSGRFGGCLIKIAKPGRSRPGIQATSPIFDPLGVARLPLFGNFSYSAFFAPC